MATHTWVDLDLPEAGTLADLHGVAWDLRNARDWAKELLAQILATPPELNLIEPLSVAIAVMYSRPYVTGVRQRLTDADLAVFTPEQREVHERLRAYRDKHIAHSVNAFEENQLRANYCVERVQQEGITSVACSGARILGLSSRDLEDIIGLSNIMLMHVESRMAVEQQRILEIVRRMPLNDVLASGHKPFVVGRDTKVHIRRKR